MTVVHKLLKGRPRYLRTIGLGVLSDVECGCRWAYKVAAQGKAEEVTCKNCLGVIAKKETP